MKYWETINTKSNLHKKYMPAFFKRLSVFYCRHNACFFDIMVRVLYIIHVILLTNKSLLKRYSACQVIDYTLQTFFLYIIFIFIYQRLHQLQLKRPFRHLAQKNTWNVLTSPVRISYKLNEVDSHQY